MENIYTKDYLIAKAKRILEGQDADYNLDNLIDDLRQCHKRDDKWNDLIDDYIEALEGLMN